MEKRLGKITAVILAIIIVISSVPMWIVAEGTELEELGDNGNDSDSSTAISIWDGTISDGFESGSGTELNPFIIGSAEQLAFFAQSVNNGTSYEGCYIKLANDIYLNDTSDWENWSVNVPANEWEPIGFYHSYSDYFAFSGTFDGDGHSVYGLYINQPTKNYCGLFGFIQYGSLKNLGLNESYVFAQWFVGGICGKVDNGVIEHCHNEGSINGTPNQEGVKSSNYVGGVCAYAERSTIVNSYNTGAISGFAFIGGVCGSCHNNSTIENCYNNGVINGETYFGGICGESFNYCTVSACFNAGKVCGGSQLGGICGINNYYSIVSDCYNAGNVTGTYAMAGGVCGNNYENSSLINCYNIGLISGYSNYVGAICGRNDFVPPTFLTNCYYLNNCAFSQQNNQFGVGNEAIGLATADIDGQTTGLSLDEMKTAMSFAGFDFDGVWKIGEVNEYVFPTLSWQEDMGNHLSHNHVFNVQNINVLYLKSPATCYSGDQYYYSCWCGEKGTSIFEQGNPVGHNNSEQNTDQQYIKRQATSSSPAQYYYSCIYCGKPGTEVFEYGDPLGSVIYDSAIRTAEEFAAMIPDGIYYLDSDIEIHESYIGEFCGSFDGNGHTVTISEPLFERLCGTVENLTIEGVVSASGYGNYCAPLALTGSGTIEVKNVINKANVTTEYRGSGLISWIENGTTAVITDCVNYGNVTFNSVVYYRDGVAAETSSMIGGIIGYQQGSHLFIRDCVNYGNISSDKGVAGGIIGRFGGDYTLAKTYTCTIYNCLNEGEVSGSSTVGGIAGVARSCTMIIQNCTNNGEVYSTGGDVAGILASSNVSKGTTQNGATNVSNCGNSDIRIDKCVNNGSITTEKGKGAGICAYVWAGGGADGVINTVDVTNCVNTASIKGTSYVSQIIVWSNSKNNIIRNNVGLGSVSAFSGTPILSFYSLSSANIPDELKNNIIVNDGTVYAIYTTVSDVNGKIIVIGGTSTSIIDGITVVNYADTIVMVKTELEALAAYRALGEVGYHSSNHTHIYNNQNTDPQYLKSGATCTAKAVYYYSCECGDTGTETFEYGEYVAHVFTAQNTSSRYLKSNATTSAPAVYYYSCQICGACGTETFEFGSPLVPTTDEAVISVYGSRFTVDGKAKRGQYSSSFTTGTEHTVVFTGDNFLFWTDGNGIILSEDPEYTFTLLNSFSLTAVTANIDEGFTNVIFLTRSGAGQIIAANTVSSPEEVFELQIPPVCNSSCVVFSGWTVTDMDSDSSVTLTSSDDNELYIYISSLVSNGVKNISVMAQVENVAVDPGLNVVGCNLSFKDSIYIKYAIDGADLSDVQLLIWTEPQTSYEFGTQSAVLESTGTETVNGRPCNIYSYSALSARMMADDVYARAYVVKSGTAYYSQVKKYSILQYALNKTGKTGTASTNQNLIDLLNAMLDYGSAAQIYAGYKTDRLANADWYQITVVGGTLPDLSDKGLYAVGETVTISAPETNEQGQQFSYWETDNGEVAGTTATATVTVVSLNKTYTAVYGSEIPDNPSSGDSVGFAYSDNGDGTCTITGIGTCTDTVITVPETIDGLTVTAIGASAFANQEAITKITLPDTITSIGRRAYYYCTNLKETNIPASVTNIGIQPFFHSGIETVTYSSNLSFEQSAAIFTGTPLKSITFNGYSVPRNICYNCTSLEEVTIANGVQYISEYAFYGCTSLSSITIPDSVTSVDSYAFQNCTNLTSITIPDSVTGISFGLFQGCTSLTSITIPDSVIYIGWYAFYNCTSLSSITIPDSVTYIGENAFSGCTGLVSITIPDGVTSISRYAFYGCTSLASITIPDSVTEIMYNAFSGCTSLTSITIPDSVTSIGDFAFENCPRLESISIPDSVMSIGYYAFRNCTSLESITIPDSVTSIGDYAFSNCTSLISISLPDSMESIGIHAFIGCTNLTSLEIPYGMTSICDYAFKDFSNLEMVTIPNSVRSIGCSAFSGCTKIETVYYDGSLEEWFQIDCSNGSYPCRDNGASMYIEGELLTEAVIPNSVTTIGLALAGCTSITSITIPDSVTSIDMYAFSGCTSLTNITIPDSVTVISDGIFYNCTNLTSVTIPDSVIRIMSNVFNGCTSLTSVTIPYGVTELYYHTFHYCTSLESVVIPDSVTSIGYAAFFGCNRLTVYYTGSEEQWNEISKSDAFSGSYAVVYNYTGANYN